MAQPFVLKKDTAPFWFGVDIPIVTESGSTRTHRFEMQFARFTRSELNDLRIRSENMPDGDSIENDTDYVMGIALDWRGVNDGSASLPFTRENVRALIDQVPNAASSIVSAFFAATLGGGAKKGN